MDVFVCRLLRKLAPLLTAKFGKALVKGKRFHYAISFNAQKSEIKRNDVNLMFVLRILDKVNYDTINTSKV